MSGGRIIIPNADPVYEAPGVPAGGATLIIYQAGTTNPADIFADADLTVPIQNPQTSSQDGLFYDQSTAIWADDSLAYDAVLTTATGMSWSYENLSVLGQASNNSGYLQNPSVQLTGSPTSTTPASNDSSSRIATTAYVQSVITALPAPPTAGATTPYSSNVKGVATGTGGTTALWSLDKAIVTSSDSSKPTIAITSVSGSINIATTGLNGLDSGSAGSNTFYWVYVISNGTTSGFIASTSSNAPAQPSGYTYSLLVGVMKTDGSSTVVPFIYYNKDFDYLIPALQTIVSGSTGGVWQTSSIASFIPNSLVARYRGTCWTNNNTQTAGVAPINPGQPTGGGGSIPGARGYAWSLGGSNGGQTYQSTPFDFPLVNSSIWYIATSGGTNCGAFFTGFKLSI